MKAWVVLALTGALSALGAGCTKKEAPPEDDTPCTVSPADSVGIAECDTFLCKHEACLRRSRGAASKALIKAERDSFKLAVTSSEGKPGLKAICVSKLAQLATDPACAPTR
jgi:hypothetical protein